MAGAMRCASCNTESEGRYCSGCGLPLKGASCRACQKELPAGAKNCPNCGVTSVAAASQSLVPWVITGFAVAAVAGYALSRPSTPTPPPAPAPVAAPLPSPAQPAMPSMPVMPAVPVAPEAPPTPRELADALFNDAMSASEQGAAAQAAIVVPQALAAYKALGPLDDDALLHVALLHLAVKDSKQARATAEQILARAPKHVLALGAGALAAGQAGDAAGVKAYSQRLVDGYEAELKTPRPEYTDHARVVGSYLEAAKRALGQ